MTQQQSIPSRAAARGFTIPLFISSGSCDLEGFVRPGTDYDSRFPLICGDTGDTLMVNGWLAEDICEGSPQ